jgi:hypothetical protein
MSPAVELEVQLRCSAERGRRGVERNVLDHLAFEVWKRYSVSLPF